MTTIADPVRYIRNAYAVLAFGGFVSLSTTLLGTDQGSLSIGAFGAPLAVVLSCVVAFAILASGGIVTLAAPSTPFVVAMGAYFGAGALLPVIAPPAYREFEQEMYPYDAVELVAAHRVTAVGLLALATAAWIGLGFIRSRRIEVGRSVDPDYLRRSAFRLLVAGTTVRLLITTPYALGMSTGFLPGSIGGFEYLAYIGLMLYAYGVFKGLLTTHSDRVILSTFSVLNIILGLISLSKLNFFFSVGALIAGVGLARPRQRVLLGLAVGVGLIYSFVQPLVNRGRELRRNAGESLTEQLSIIPTASSIADESIEGEYVKWFALARFNYVAPTVFSVRSYDNGERSRSMTDKILWTVVPRFLWPSKPNMTESGRDVAWLMIGLDEGFVGIGIFGEGYWNAGYLGVVLAAAFVGLLLALFEGWRGAALETFDVASMYLFWYGCIMGFRIDDWFLPTYVGVWPIVIGTFVVIRAAFGVAPKANVEATQSVPVLDPAGLPHPVS